MLLIFGVTIVTVGGLITLVSPFAGLLFYWAWLLVRPQEVVLGLGGWLPLERFLAIALIISLIVHWKIIRPRRFNLDPVFLAMLGFLAVNYLSILTSIWKSNSLEISNNFAKLILFCFCAINLLDTPDRIRKFLWVYVLCVGVQAVTGITNYWLHPFYAQGVQRATSLTETWGDPNATAANLALALPFLFVLGGRGCGWLKRLLLMGLFAVYLVCLVLTASRIGWVLLLLISLLTALRARRRILLVPALICSALVGWALIPVAYQQRYGTIVSDLENPRAHIKSSQGQSAYGRIVGFMVAVEIFKDNPILGVGAGNFADAWWSMNYSYEGFRGYHQPHNLPGQIISELGVVGLASFVFYVFKLLGMNHAIAHALKNQRNPLLVGINWAIWVLVFSLIVQGFTAHNMYRYNWYLAGVLVAATRIAVFALREKEPVLAPEISSELSPSLD